MKDKPAGVTLLAILFFTLGVLSLVWGMLVLGVSGLSAFIGSLWLVVPLAALVYLLTPGLRQAYHVNKAIPG